MFVRHLCTHCIHCSSTKRLDECLHPQDLSASPVVFYFVLHCDALQQARQPLQDEEAQQRCKVNHALQCNGNGGETG